MIQPEYGADGLTIPALCANACRIDGFLTLRVDLDWADSGWQRYERRADGGAAGRALIRALAHMLEPFGARSGWASVMLRFEVLAVRISLIERTDPAEYAMLKARRLNPSGRCEVVGFLQDDMLLMTGDHLTDDEMREWEVVRNRLVAALVD